MKIDTRDLRESYRAGIAGKTPDSRRACPSLSDIADLFDSKTSSRKKAKLMDHVVRCGACAEEFESWLALHREKETLIQDLCAWASRHEGAGRESGIKDRRADYEKRTGRNPRALLEHIFRRPVLAGGVAILAMAMMLGLWLVLRSPRPPEYRASPPTGISLKQPPPGGIVDPAVTVFSWSPLTSVDYYILEIFDDSLAPVWKSPETGQTRLRLPPKVGRYLRPGPSYYWLVTAILRNAKRVESEIGSFRVKTP